MTDTTRADRLPRLGFLEPETEGEMVVHLFDLAGVQAPFKGSRFTVEPGGTSPVDTHQVQEIWMVAAGRGELSYDGRSFRVEPGDVVHFEAMKPHQLHNDGDATLVVFSVWW